MNITEENTKEKMYTLEEVAAKLKVSFSWIVLKVKEGTLKSVKRKPIKGRTKKFIKESELIRFEKVLKEWKSTEIVPHSKSIRKYAQK